jgi:hypothetical protein
MSRVFRMGLLAVGAVILAFAAGFYLQAPWAVMLWPVPSGPLSNIFISSILAAIACPVIWIVLADERRAIAAGALDLIIANAGIAAAGFYFYAATGNTGMLAFGFISVILLLAMIVLFRYGHQAPFRDTRPMPLALRVAFGIFALLLAIVGSLLVAVHPNIFPWPLGPENSVIYGFIFLGAMCYFLYGLYYPVWGNAAGQMVGFIAYDIVLILPFIRHFANVKPEMHTSLVIYTTVVVASALIALYFLFLHPETRFGARRVAA